MTAWTAAVGLTGEGLDGSGRHYTAARLSERVYAPWRLWRPVRRPAMVEHHEHGPTSGDSDDGCDDLVILIHPGGRGFAEVKEHTSGRDRLAKRMTRKHSGNKFVAGRFPVRVEAQATQPLDLHILAPGPLSYAVRCE